MQAVGGGMLQACLLRSMGRMHAVTGVLPCTCGAAARACHWGAPAVSQGELDAPTGSILCM